MNRQTIALYPLLLSALSCAGLPARFETSLEVPEAEQSNTEHLHPYQAPPRNLAHPTHDSQVATEMFLLALENGTTEQLEALLAPGAQIREESSGSGNAALPALLSLARSWNGVSSSAGSTDARAATAPFGPAEIVEISTHSNDAWATVFVAGPPLVQGYWKLNLENRGGSPQIHEVIIPKNH